MELVNTTIDDIASVIGFTAAVRLIANYGGRDIHVPFDYNPDHPITKLIGDSRMKALVQAWPGERMSVPTLAVIRQEERNAKVLSLLLNDVDCYAIANVSELGYRRVKQLKQEFITSGILREK